MLVLPVWQLLTPQRVGSKLLRYQRKTLVRLRAVIMVTYMNNLTGLASCLTTCLLEDTRFHAKFCLKILSDFKQDFTPFLKDFDIKPVLTITKDPQAKYPLERVHQVMLNILVEKYLSNKVFNCIYPWGEPLAYIAWSIRASYHRNIMDTPVQYFFCRCIIFNLMLVIDWRVITALKQRQLDIDSFRSNARRVMHDYTIGDKVYLEMTGIYHKLDYGKQVPFIITEVFYNGTVLFQWGGLPLPSK